MGRNVLPWGEVSMGRNVRGAKSPDTGQTDRPQTQTGRVAYYWQTGRAKQTEYLARLSRLLVVFRVVLSWFMCIY